jgi:hypothetical protein
MALPFPRAYARWPCDIEVLLFLGQARGRLIGRGLLIDISLSGAFLRSSEDMKVGSFYRLHVAGSADKTEFPFRVAREGPRKHLKKKEIRHYGLTFVLNPSEEQRLRLLIDRLPRENTLEEDVRDRSTRNYWSR